MYGVVVVVAVAPPSSAVPSPRCTSRWSLCRGTSTAALSSSSSPVRSRPGAIEPAVGVCGGREGGGPPWMERGREGGRGVESAQGSGTGGCRHMHSSPSSRVRSLIRTIESAAGRWGVAGGAPGEGKERKRGVLKVSKSLWQRKAQRSQRLTMCIWRSQCFSYAPIWLLYASRPAAVAWVTLFVIYLDVYRALGRRQPWARLIPNTPSETASSTNTITSITTATTTTTWGQRQMGQRLMFIVAWCLFAWISQWLCGSIVFIVR